jgi:hypothetical protein
MTAALLLLLLLSAELLSRVFARTRWAPTTSTTLLQQLAVSALLQQVLIKQP